MDKAGTEHGWMDLYGLVRQINRDGKDVQQVRLIQGGDGSLKDTRRGIGRRKEYFEKLMNEVNERKLRVEDVTVVDQKAAKACKVEVRT